MTLSVSLFLISRNLWFSVFLPRKIIATLRKRTINFRQVSLKGVLLSVRVTEYLFSIWVFFPKHSRFTGQQGKREAIFLTLLYHVHPLHKHLKTLARGITAKHSPLHKKNFATHELLHKHLLRFPVRFSQTFTEA